jgi:hypothetical protein
MYNGQFIKYQAALIKIKVTRRLIGWFNRIRCYRKKRCHTEKIIVIFCLAAYL